MSNRNDGDVYAAGIESGRMRPRFGMSVTPPSD